uniref:Protein transport protein Sec24B n=1 Tax=Aceria tosichella TaxID=561515 RepID=A0A6G1SKV8_9ACAR
MFQQSAICCTLNNVPMTASALQKSRLPFAIHIYPFAQDDNIPVSSDGIIVRCTLCRAYINPYVRLGEHQSWLCNICNRTNDMPPQYIWDYENQQYYDLSTKPELNSETVEYLAGDDYIVRPPQPTSFMFVMDCSKAAYEIGYLPILAAAIADSLDSIPGDARATIGFIAYDSNIHYFSFSGTQVVHYSHPDVSESLLPCSNDGILVNMASKREMILDFLTQILPYLPSGDPSIPVTDTRSAMGPAIKAAARIMAPIGGKIVIVQAQLPNHGDKNEGSVLERREDPSAKKNMTNDKNGEYLTPLINPTTDFYKNLSVETCEHQVSIDLFNLSTTYADLASLCPLTKFNAGMLYHYSNSPSEHKSTLIRFDQDIRNYLIRILGLEAVLRIRYTRGLKIHTFHGNFFVRSCNLLILPIANPDTAYALQIAIEDDLNPNTRYVYFQASVLYSTPCGERRIRVHTARYPTASTLPEIIYGANQTAIVGMLAKMAVDRSQQASVGEAKEALIGAGVDLLEIYSIADQARAMSYPMGLPENLRLVPLYILAMLKHIAFRLGPGIKLDDRVAAMERFKTLPLEEVIAYIYPDLFPIHNIANDPNEDWKTPTKLTAACLERNGAYLLDAYDVCIIYICEYIDPRWCYDVFGVCDYASIQEKQDVYASTEVANSYQNQITRPPTNFPGSSAGLVRYNQQIGTSKDLTNSVTNSIPTPDEIAEAPIVDLPELENAVSMRLRDFISCILESRSHKPKFYIIKETGRAKSLFTRYLLDDRSESYLSFSEFQMFLRDQARRS